MASFRLSADELDEWLFGFDAMYPAYVLDVYGLAGNDCETWWTTFVEEVAANIARKMTFGDAVLLREAESYRSQAIVTWNTKDFARLTQLRVLTPTGFLRQHWHCLRDRISRPRRQNTLYPIRGQLREERTDASIVIWHAI